MKRILCAVAISAIFSASAMAEPARLVVNSDVVDQMQDQPWMISFQSLQGGYTRVLVEEEYLNIAKDALSTLGAVYDDTPVYAIDVIPDGSELVADAYSQAVEDKYTDPKYIYQTELYQGYNAIELGKDSVRDINARPVIAILDTGAVAHEDLVFMGGYSLTTLYEQDMSNDFTDNGYSGATLPNSCYGEHGNQMAGIIGATTNNSKGIVGIAGADMYMGRVMTTNCNTGQGVGSISDLYSGLLWANGQIPANKIPRPDIVSVSLAADTLCPPFLQDAINGLVSEGTSIVVSAGNNFSQVAKYAPANCQNVIVVGAHNANGQRSSYTNTGDQVDVSVNGSRLTASSDSDGYARADGTSGAAAAVTGAIAVIKSNFTQATPYQLEYVIKHSATEFPSESVCTVDYCGDGMLNLYDAMRMSEKLIDPVITFSHAFLETDDCRTTREIEAVKGNIDACNATQATAITHYQEAGVEYNYRVYRKKIGTVGWGTDSATVLNSVTADSDKFIIPILDTDFEEYEYSVAACESSAEDAACPFHNEMKESDIIYPDSCK